MASDAYQEHIQSDAWKAIRLQVLQRDEYRCRVCNAEDGLEVHHRTYERLGREQLGDLTTLCERCHLLYTEISIKPGDTVTLQDAVKEAFRRVDHRMQTGGGILTGLTDFDFMACGFHDAELTVIASRASVGKTALATSIVRHVAVESKSPVLFVSPELTHTDIASRLLCCQSRVDSHLLLSGRLSVDDQSKIIEAGEILKSTPLIIDDTPGQSILRVVANARKQVKENGIRMIVIDAVSYIEAAERRISKQEQIGNVIRRLKILARELGIPIIALSQIPRVADGDRQDRLPRLADLHDYGASEQDADSVILLHRDFAPGNQDGIVVVILAKQRNGPTGSFNLRFTKKFMRFEDA